MKIYDLSKELFSAAVFPGDPAPGKTPFYTIGPDRPCNVTVLTLGSHNGTHMDAPLHFIAGGKGMDEVSLEKCVGPCAVVEHSGKFGAEDAQKALAGGVKRLLLKGEIELTVEGAEALAKGGLWFLGVEHMTVGTPKTGTDVHRALLSAEIVLLESAVMREVPAGKYFLSSAPLKMAGLDGSPCRPLLIDFEEGAGGHAE